MTNQTTNNQSVITCLSNVLDWFKVKREAEGFKFDESLLKEVQSDLDFLAEAYEVSPLQAFLFALIVEKSSDYRMDLSDLANVLDMSFISSLRYGKDLSVLSSKWMIQVYEQRLKVPSEVMNSLTADMPFKKPDFTGMNSVQILSTIKSLLKKRRKEEIDDKNLSMELRDLISMNPDTVFSREINALGIRHSIEWKLLIILCSLYYNEDDDMVGWHDIEPYVNELDFTVLQNGYKAENLILQKNNIITYAEEGGLMTKEYFKITDSVKERLFADAEVAREKATPAINMLDANSLAYKKLFYGPSEQRSIDTLERMLCEEQYRKVRNSLRDSGLRTGFTCLFYGTPGTGKTETVYQLAKKTGRKIIVADVSKLKNCFVGESEKSLTKLFDDYRKCVKTMDIAPILLFNEADAIFGIRQEGAQRAVDKMENSLQNILLQEMEKLDGILIATTNLTQNLDKAFERRFLYKVRFEKPSLENKSKIWSSMMPELTENQAEELAREYDFSGGQIENISRKKKIQSIIECCEPDFATLKEYCGEEQLNSEKKRRRIGF